MLREMHGKQALPKGVTNQLAGTLFSVPSSTAPYLIGLVITPISFGYVPRMFPSRRLPCFLSP